MKHLHQGPSVSEEPVHSGRAGRQMLLFFFFFAWFSRCYEDYTSTWPVLLTLKGLWHLPIHSWEQVVKDGNPRMNIKLSLMLLIHLSENASKTMWTKNQLPFSKLEEPHYAYFKGLYSYFSSCSWCHHRAVIMIMGLFISHCCLARRYEPYHMNLSMNRQGSCCFFSCSLFCVVIIFQQWKNTFMNPNNFLHIKCMISYDMICLN